METKETQVKRLKSCHTSDYLIYVECAETTFDVRPAVYFEWGWEDLNFRAETGGQGHGINELLV